eukprot:11928208-Heterocapsa_arctica.AAC.1
MMIGEPEGVYVVCNNGVIGIELSTNCLAEAELWCSLTYADNGHRQHRRDDRGATELQAPDQ